MKSLRFAILAAAALLVEPAAQAPLCGDCNLDGAAQPDLLDALVAARINAGLAPLMHWQPCTCDVNHDGSIGVLDVLLLAQLAVTLPVTLDCPNFTDPACQNSLPGGGFSAPAMLEVCSWAAPTLNFSTTDGNPGDLLVTTFEFTTDAGATWVPCTASGSGSMTTNPSAPRLPGTSLSFGWSVASDIPVATLPVTVGLRFRVTDGLDSAVVLGGTSNLAACATYCRLFIAFPCNANACATSNIPLTLDVNDAQGDPLTVLLEVRVWSGGMWGAYVPCTPAASPPGQVNPMAGVPAGSALSWVWNAAADVPPGSDITLRATVSDGVTAPAISYRSHTLESTWGQSPPSCGPWAPAGGTTLTGNANLQFTAVDQDFDCFQIHFKFSTDGGATYSLCTPGPPSPWGAPNPYGWCTGHLAGGVAVWNFNFRWNTAADLPGQLASVRFLTETWDCCFGPRLVVQNYVVDNR